MEQKCSCHQSWSHGCNCFFIICFLYHVLYFHHCYVKVSFVIGGLPVEVTQICILERSETFDFHVPLWSLVLHLLTYIKIEHRSSHRFPGGLIWWKTVFPQPPLYHSNSVHSWWPRSIIFANVVPLLIDAKAFDKRAQSDHGATTDYI